MDTKLKARQKAYQRAGQQVAPVCKCVMPMCFYACLSLICSLGLSLSSFLLPSFHPSFFPSFLLMEGREKRQPSLDELFRREGVQKSEKSAMGIYSSLLIDNWCGATSEWRTKPLNMERCFWKNSFLHLYIGPRCHEYRFTLINQVPDVGKNTTNLGDHCLHSKVVEPLHIWEACVWGVWKRDHQR